MTTENGNFMRAPRVAHENSQNATRRKTKQRGPCNFWTCIRPRPAAAVMGYAIPRGDRGGKEGSVKGTLALGGNLIIIFSPDRRFRGCPFQYACSAPPEDACGSSFIK